MGRRLHHPDSLESIYRKYAGRVRWVLRGRGVPESALDDLVHDVFLAIHRRLPSRDGTVPLGIWIVGVTRNVAFSHRRASARTSARERDLPTPGAWPAPDDVYARREAWENLEAFLGALEPPQREVFVMVDVLGMSAVEVARSTAVAANTVYSRLRLARRKFEHHFTELEDETKAAFIRRARQQGRVPPEERRRAWAAIAAEVGTLPVIPEASLLTKLGLGLLGAGATAAVGWVALPEVPSRPVAPILAHVEPPPHPAKPRVAPAAVVRTPPAPDEPPPAPRRVRPRPEPPADDLATQLERLRTAKQTLNRGEPREALAMVDRFVADFPRTTFEVEARRLAHEAACALGRTDRAQGEVERLRTLGVAAPTPCEERTPTRDGSG